MRFFSKRSSALASPPASTLAESAPASIAPSAQRNALGRRGYLPAILSSRRGILAEDQEGDHRKLWRQGIPVVAIWAGQDPIIPLRAVGLMGLWNRDARQDVIEDADHGLPYTHGPQVVEALRALLRP